METHTYPYFPAEVSTVHFALYTNVSNASELKRRLVAASNLPGKDGVREREAVNFAFVDARLITSRLHIQTAWYQAGLAYTRRSLRTKTIHSEILWTLSPSHNISEAIKRFGVSDASTALIVLRVSARSFTRHEFETEAGLAVKGDLTPMSLLEQVTDWRLVQKYYKLDVERAMLAGNGSESNDAECQTQERELTDKFVVSCVAMKSVSA